MQDSSMPQKKAKPKLGPSLPTIFSPLQEACGLLGALQQAGQALRGYGDISSSRSAYRACHIILPAPSVSQMAGLSSRTIPKLTPAFPDRALRERKGRPSCPIWSIKRFCPIKSVSCPRVTELVLFAFRRTMNGPLFSDTLTKRRVVPL